MKKLNRFGLLVAAVVSACGTSTVSACDPPNVVRLTTVAVVSTQSDCEKLVVLRKLESFQTPVHSRVNLCENELAAAEAAVKQATEARDAASVRVSKSLERVECTAGILETMCDRVCIGDSIYTKEEVGNALRTVIADHRTDKEILELSEAALAQRQATLVKVGEKVAKWKRAEQELLQQVALLKAEQSVRTALAAGGQVQPALAMPTSPEKLLSDLNNLLESNRSATVTAAKVATVQPQTDETEKLLQEVDEIINGQSGLIVTP
jgi:hypothetical protein